MYTRKISLNSLQFPHTVTKNSSRAKFNLIMAACFKQLKSIKKDTRFTVFGYVRQNENKLSLYCNIPSMISYLCLSYYYHGEYFEKAGHDIQISNDKMTVTKVTQECNWDNAAYGKTWIDSSIDQIVKWKFKINTLERSIYICLVSKDNCLIEIATQGMILLILELLLMEGSQGLEEK